MKILHTSDWHIGRALYGRKRYEEHEAFLEWLAGLIEQEQVETLLVAGDIFDNSVPSNKAQEMYYGFLCRVANSSCRHVVVIAGNHDSPSFLDAPRELLRFLNVYVVGGVTGNVEDELLVLTDSQGKEELILCAVPYLRDRDVRSSEALESVEDKEKKLVEGIGNHYRAILDLAEKKRDALDHKIPIIAMGHLFAAGGHTVEGDGVRSLYVGSLARVGKDIFPDSIDYLALGHLHAPQKVKESTAMRYSGSPIPMGFAEAQQGKVVCMVEFEDTQPKVTEIAVPLFRELEVIQGDLLTITRRLEELKKAESNAWLEIDYKGDEIPGNLRKNFDEAIEGTALEILRIKNDRVLRRTLGGGQESEFLENLDIDSVFERCLDAHQVSGKQREDLLSAYKEVIAEIHQGDSNAE